MGKVRVSVIRRKLAGRGTRAAAKDGHAPAHQVVLAEPRRGERHG